MIAEHTIAMKPNTLRLLIVALISNYSSIGWTKSSSSMEFEMVQVLFRHGERTLQKHEYNILNYTGLSAYEPFGLEHLTNNGKMQAYRVGEMLKERYKDFFNETNISLDVYARSSETSRSRMTLELVLAGLFPPTDELRWHPNLDWQPIKYRYVPSDMDALLKTYLTGKFNKLYLDVWKSPWGLEKLASYKDIFELLDKHGIKVSTNDMMGLGIIHNILQINERMNLSLPAWCTDDLKLRFQQAFELWHDSLSHTQQLKRLNGGPMIRTFVNNMNLNGSVANPKKLYLYSGHDMNVAAVIRALNVEGFQNSDFCSTLIFEKWRDPKNEVFVRLLHWNGVKEEMSIARMGSCEEFCPIDEFLELIRNVIPTDEELFSLFDQFDVNCVKRFFL